MPFVGVAISAIGTAFSAGGMFAAGGALSLVGKLLTTVAVSALSRALADKPGVPGIRNERTQAGGINPASFILGRYATGGTAVCPEMSYGLLNGFGMQPETPNEYLVYVIDLGDIPGGAGLEQIIVDGVLVPLGSAPESLPEIPIFTTTTDPQTGQPQQVQTGVIPAVSKGLPGTGDYARNIWVKFKDGTDTVADPYLRRVFGEYPERPWTADMIGTGVPHVILTFRRNPKLFRGFPQCRFVAGGIPLYDWRKDSTAGGVGSHRWNSPATWEPSENPIVQVYNILRGIRLEGGFVWGGRAPASALRIAEWTLAANTADAAVTLASGATEPFARASFEVTVADEPAAIIEDLLRGCNGQIADVGGQWRIRIGAPALPIWSFSDEDVITSSPQDLTPFPPQANTFNAVTAVFPDPEMNWEPTEAPARYNAAWEVLDGDQRLPADLSLPATPYPNQVQRVMRAYIEAERRFASHILTLPPEASQFEPLDTLSWSSASNGYAAKGFEVAEVAVDLLGGNAQVSLREVDPTDYSWQPSFELPFNRPSNAVVARPPAQVRGAAASAVTLTDAASAARRPGIRVVWAAAQFTMFRGLQWEFRIAGTTETRVGSTQAIEAGEATIAEGILPGTAYQIRLAWVADQEIAWTPWLDVTTPDVRLGEADLAPAITGAITTAQGDIAAAQALIRTEIEGRALTDLVTLREADRAAAVTMGALLQGFGEGETRRSELAFLKQEVTAKIESNLAAVADETAARADADSALAARTTTLEATTAAQGSALASTQAAISDEALARADADSAIATRATTLEATVNSPTTGLAATRAQVSAADTALANAVSAVAGRTTTLETTAGGLVAAVETQQTAVATLAGNAAASFVLRTRAGGATGEIEVVAADNPAGAASAVVIRSDRFTFAGDLAEFLGSVKIQGDLIAGGAVSRRAFISNWASKRVTATTLASAEQLGAVTSFNPAAYVGAADSPDNPTLISLSMALGPDGAAAGRISFALECDSGAGWSVRATQGVSFPSSWFGGYPVLRLVGSLAHGNLPFPAGSWRIRAYLQSGSPPVFISSFVATIEQVNK